MKNDCVFCAMAAGGIPASKIYEDDTVFACLDINPCSPGHTLVFPKEHVRDILEATPRLLSAVMERVRKIAEHLKSALPCDGFNILQNNGECAGQSVFHLHFHIVPRSGAAAAPRFEPRPADMAALPALAARLAFD